MDLQNMKKILKKIFFLSPVPTLLISIPAYSLVIYALAGERVDPVIKYLSYFLSAYALVITVTGTVGVVRFVREGMKKHPLIRKILGIPVVNRYLGEDLFRAETALYQGFFSSLLYAGIKMCSGIFYRSVWFVTLAVYYILPALMRASLLHYVATVWALVLGVIGTAFMAGSTFAVTAQPPHIVLCIILAIPGFLGWILPYFLYKRIQVKETEKIAPLIEAKYDEIYEICEKGNRLLY